MPRLVLLAMLLCWPALAADGTTFYRIGAGATGETHFALGGVIANALSNPPGSRACERGGSCGVPGLIAVAQSTEGAIGNVLAIQSGAIEAGLVRADVATWAFRGEGPFAKAKPADSLRAVATLYPDTLHVVARRDAGIDRIEDLAGKRVALGEKGTGAAADALLVLDAHGLSQRDVKSVWLRPGPAADALARGELDAFFALDGIPAAAVAELAREAPIDLLAVYGPPAEALRRDHPFFQVGAIPAGTYRGVDRTVPTVEMDVVLVVSTSAPDRLVKAITRALWHPTTLALIAESHPSGRSLRLGPASLR
ncbi:MAG: TAXI family TRAP transporter solute-binding subunit, partial [Alphaproteobacteria bacterium]|nr:TAXI family TRAP transporter solute-binding subunit [Alphaproteobacteria bacterium]